MPHKAKLKIQYLFYQFIHFICELATAETLAEKQINSNNLMGTSMYLRHNQKGRESEIKKKRGEERMDRQRSFETNGNRVICSFLCLVGHTARDLRHSRYAVFM